jgi:hypothetical protein
MGRRFVLILIAGLASCDKPSDPSIKESAQLNQRAKLASDLYMMAKGASISTEKAISLGAELKNTATVQDYVDTLVETKMPYGLAKSFFFGGGQGVKNRHPIPAFSNLKTFSSDNKTVYRLRTQCETEDIISLRPWWQAEPVWVCADAVKASAPVAPACSRPIETTPVVVAPDSCGAHPTKKCVNASRHRYKER